jgi:ABC-type branched-subunit amino acid transport system substrate-binding protein
MKNASIFFSFLLALTFSGSLVSAEDLIGIGVPLSGDGAWLGENVLKGVNLYLKENGLKKEDVLRIEDVSAQQSNTSSGIMAIRKLIDVDKVSSLIMCVSPVVNASAPYIDEKMIPSIAIVGADTAKGKKFQTRMWILPEDEAMAYSEFLKGKKVALLYSEQDAMLALKSGLEKALDSSSKILFSSSVDAESMNTVILKAIKAKPDVVVMYLVPGLTGLAAKKLKQYKFSGGMLGWAGVGAPNELNLSEGALKGAFYPDANYSDEFRETYKKEYGREPEMGIIAVGYDSAKLVYEAIKESGGDREKMNALIHKEKFTGVMGDYGIKMDGSNSYKVPVILREVK